MFRPVRPPKQLNGWLTWAAARRLALAQAGMGPRIWRWVGAQTVVDNPNRLPYNRFVRSKMEHKLRPIAG